MRKLAKYFGSPADSSGKPLWWPGTADGFPVRGSPPPMMKQDEFESIPHVVDAKVELLELPRDLARYQEVLDKIANGWFALRSEKIDYDPEEKIYRVLLQWLEIYGQAESTQDPMKELTNDNGFVSTAIQFE